MKFTTPWKVYHESEMECHEPEGPGGPLIYVANDRTCVWVESTDPRGQPQFEIADVDEITELWKRYRITSLLSVAKFADSSRLGKDSFKPFKIHDVPTREARSHPLSIK
jgi:hypothetical protein